MTKLKNCPSLICIGYCGWDTLCTLPKIPLDAKARILSMLEQGGGPSATAACAAAKLGIKTAFCGTVGDDATGRNIIKSLKQCKVDPSGIVVREDSASARAFCWVERNSGKRSIAWTSGDALPLQLSELPRDDIRNADAIHLDGHQAEAAIAAAKIAISNGVHVSLDAGTIVQGIDRLLELADIIIASEKFAAEFTGKSDLTDAMHALFDMGDTIFAGVTMGAKGAIGFDGETVFTQKAFPVDVKDTTGAGDTYHGAFLASFIKGHPPQECMRRAAAASAMKCRLPGGRTGQPTATELKNFLSQY